MLRKLFSFKGRVERSRFIFNFTWSLYILVHVLIGISGDDYDFGDAGTTAYLFVKLMFILMAVLLSIVFLSNTTKRAHDLDKSGFEALNPIIFFKLFFVKGDSSENRYGKNPLDENGLVKSGDLNPAKQVVRPATNTNQIEELHKTTIPSTCTHCKNPNTKMLLVCEWCGEKIC